MANSRRQRRASSTPARTTPRTAAGTPAASTRAVETVDWKEEYAYVFEDLRQLVIVSVAIFALLLVIGFFI